MKRIILTGSLLLAFAAALQAQNTATVSQNGNSQSNTIDQSGSNNQTLIRQLTGTALLANTGNKVGVTQQATATLPLRNQAFIDQINGADYDQATIGQTMGSGNIATIEQAGGHGFRSGGTSLADPASVSGGTDGTGNVASITQTGAGNDQTTIKQNAGVRGGSGANVARITQVGNTNLGTVIEQSNRSFGNLATIAQGSGSGGATANTAVVLQNDDSQHNRASVVQEGANKIADVQQTTGSSHNQLQVSQLGIDGFATVYQTDQADHNQATVGQTSSSNGGSNATVYQTNVSAYNTAFVEQKGTVDNALINQSEQSKNNVASIAQGVGGLGNSAVITQTYAYDGAGNGTGLGTGNTARITQNQTSPSSTGNQAEVTQGFAGGISTVSGNTVISDNNGVVIGQENDLNVAKVMQGGVSNQAGVTQRGWSTLKGLDSGEIINDVAEQLGNLNVLSVTQTGVAGNPATASVRQVGIGNVGTIIQTPVGN